MAINAREGRAPCPIHDVSDGGSRDSATSLRDDPASYREVVSRAAVAVHTRRCHTTERRMDREEHCAVMRREHERRADFALAHAHPALASSHESAGSTKRAVDAASSSSIIDIERHAVAVTAAIWEIPVNKLAPRALTLIISAGRIPVAVANR